VDRAKLQIVRLPEEKEMVESLSRSVNLPVLRRLAKENPLSGYSREYYYSLKATTLPVKGGINRRLEDVFRQVRSELGLLDEPIELFVVIEESFNCHLEIANNKVLPSILRMSHTFAQTLNEKEIAYVLGHELGHLIFEHGETGEALSLLYPKKDSMPEHIKRQYKYLHQLQEFEVAVNYFKLNAPSKLDAMIGEIALFIVRDKRIEDKELETFIEIMENILGWKK